jgi:hypothetical protein
VTLRYLRLLIVLAVFAGFPAVAFAYKAATPAQKRALVRAFGGSRVPARCITARISTANPSFAEVYFTGLWGAGQHMPPGRERYAANGVTIFRSDAGRWRAVTAGSDFATTAGGCRVPHVPTPVARTSASAVR